MKTKLDEMRQIKSIGNVKQLVTKNKENVVVAINEIKTDSDSKVGCKDYDGSSGVNIPPISGLGGGVGITPVGLQFKWVGTKLGVKRENAYLYAFMDLKGEQGEPGRDGIPGKRGDRGPKGESGFPSKSDWQTLLERMSALESINDIKPNYQQSEITYIADILTASNRTVNINYGVLSKLSVLKHEISIDGGITFKSTTSTNVNGFFNIKESFSSYNIGDVAKCMVRVITSDGEYIYSNIFEVTVTDSDVTSEPEYSLANLTYEVRQGETLIVKFDSNKNVNEVLLSINGGTYCHKGIVESDRVIFILGNLMPSVYSCRLKVTLLDDNKVDNTFETVAFDVEVKNTDETVPRGEGIEVKDIEVRKYINEYGTVDKRMLSFRFSVPVTCISEVRYFYYNVDNTSFSPLENVKYIGNGIFECNIPWVFDPYANRRLEVLCSRLPRKSVENNMNTSSIDFSQDYNGDPVVPEII